MPHGASSPSVWRRSQSPVYQDLVAAISNKFVVHQLVPLRLPGSHVFINVEGGGRIRRPASNLGAKDKQEPNVDAGVQLFNDAPDDGDMVAVTRRTSCCVCGAALTTLPRSSGEQAQQSHDNRPQNA